MPSAVCQTYLRVGLTHSESHKLVKSFLRTTLGIFFMLAGCVLILGAGLFTLHLALTGYLAAHPAYLAVASQPDPALLALNIELAPTVVPAQSVAHIAAALSANADGFTDGNLHLGGLSSAAPALPPGSLNTPVAASMATPLAAPTALPTAPPTAEPTPTPDASLSYPLPTPILSLDELATAEIPTPEPTPTPTIEFVPFEPAPTEAPLPPPEPAAITPPDPIVRISIPALKIKRAVIDIGLAPGENGAEQWDTGRLFATKSRPDLVGHLEGSPLPGEGGNTVLVGHNYDNVGNGVFVNLHNIEVGDEITLITESGQEYVYQVVKVKSVAYTGSEADIERHMRFLGLTPDERLTLVTCGGVRIGFYNKRVYVVAVPVQP
jgi:LPXTG-site transpeptidase (sortase) family protein